MSTLSPPTFDPYQVWLKVVVDRRSPNAYQLLGLAPLETSRPRIEAAIVRQRAALDTIRDQADPELWNRISQELDEAISTMTLSECKAVLDARLRRQGVGAAAATSAATSAGDAASAVVCRRCDKPNLPDRKFCAQCGHSLWEACPSCSALGPGGEQFCGQCGVDMRRFMDQRGEELQAAIERANGLQELGHFEAAADALREVAKVEDRRLDAWAGKAARMLDEYAAERRRREGSAHAALELARRQFAENDLEAAITSLEQVPPTLRGAEHQTLLQDAVRRRQEIQTLHAEIRAGLDAKKFIEVLGKIQRLLAMQPDEEQVRQLGVQIGRRLAQGAKKMLLEHRYDAACQLLGQIPEFAAPPELPSLVDQASELRSMLQELHAAPLASPALLAIAERLAKAAPENEDARRLLTDLRRRAAGGSSTPWRAHADWKPAQSKSAIGLTVDAWDRPRRWTSLAETPSNPAPSTPESSKPEAANARSANDRDVRPSSRFFVAYGLALQALGLATLDMNLAPQEKKSFLAGLSLGRRKKPESAAWGVDLGSTSLKAVRLVVSPATGGAAGECSIDACEWIEYPCAADSPDADVEQTTAAEQALKTFLSRHTIGKSERVAVNLPGLRVLGRFVQTPPVEPKKLDALVEFEARRQIPYPLDELVWDHATVDRVEGDAKAPQPRRVLILGCKANHARARMGIFERAGMKVDILQSDAVALHNFARYDLPDETAALLDVGGDVSHLVISGPDALWFRTLGVGAADFARALVKQLQLTREQAEQVLREPARAKRLYKRNEALAPAYSQFVGEVQRSLAAFRSFSPDLPLTRLYGVGGGFQLHGLLAHLRG